ncbi:MarR family winged helix-turn-helix transcriptional regulator [Caldimonas tepidiphila]|uniref:MarR family winged helix-turn-helix transcriptional regulator n=1 Tax=Caldimonas tepidiphila TaxID=2315841 RepID=UPI000E5BF590|nr:MarR family transcriptional regulator [Caldimonas tepidiphila]
MAKQVDNVNDMGVHGSGDVLDAIQSVAHLVRSRQLQVLRGGEEDLTPLEARVLLYFLHHPGGTLGELTEHSGRDKSQLGRLLGGLKERGWLQAETDEKDRRLVRFTLTERARRRQKSMMSQRSQLIETAIHGFTDAERHSLLALLERVRSNLDSLA